MIKIPIVEIRKEMLETVRIASYPEESFENFLYILDQCYAIKKGWA